MGATVEKVLVQAGIAADDFAGEEGVEDLDPEAEGLEENEYDEVPEGGEDDGSEYEEPGES